MKIDLCFITDETYVLPTATALESLKENKDPNVQYVAHVVCRDVSESGIATLKGAAGCGVDVDIIERSSLPVSGSRVSLVRHVSPTAIFKFFIPDILPHLDRVIYLDSDILIQGDLSELWQADISNLYAAVVKDSKCLESGHSHLEWLGFRQGSYFNSGVMLLNLRLMRRDGITAKLMDYRIRGRNRFMDQDALNVVFGGQVRFVSIRYNCLNWLFEQGTIDELRELFGADDVADTPEQNWSRAVVLHMGGSEKPWMRDDPYYTEVYRGYAARIGWQFMFPRVSVIIPVYNASAHLRQCLCSVLAQTMTDIDVVCVDNGSTDDSYGILEEYAAQDSRMRIFRQTRKGAGMCRNFGISRARGAYVGFVDSDDFIDADYFQRLYDQAVTDDSDVCMTSIVKECSASGVPLHNKNMGTNGRSFIVGAKERGDLILASGVTWNKIYRRRYLESNKLHYSELPCAGEDKVFDFGMLFTANKISVIDDVAYYYRQTGSSSESFRRKGRESFAIIDFYREIKGMLDAADMSEYDKAWWRSIVKRNRDAEFRMFSNRMDWRLRQEFLAKCVETFYDDRESARRMQGLVVSLTSFPGRIETVHRTIKSLLGQSIRPEYVVLWLGEEQFPSRETELPRQLLDLLPYGLEIRWCKDTRSYKKLLPALQSFPGKCIVTADDDVIYPRFWLEKLWQTHIEHPKDVVAHRLRRIEQNAFGILPYKEWPLMTRAVVATAPLALQTGAGGVLYPANCFDCEIFNEEVFLSLAPRADDIWFWAMGVRCGLETRQVVSYEGQLNIVAGSQKVALSHDNWAMDGNDPQLLAILRHSKKVWKAVRAAYWEQRRAAFAKSVGRAIYRCIKVVRFVVKMFVPYGLMLLWLFKVYGIKLDKPLFFYPGVMKRLRRCLKFSMPYGFVMLSRVCRWGRAGIGDL